MNKKIYKIIIALLSFILICIPFIPYKLPNLIDRPKSIYLELQNTQSTGGYTVISGTNFISEYAQKNNQPYINLNEIYITGKLPYDEIKVTNGIFDFTKFKVYGSFTDTSSKNNVLTFNVSEWYPLETYIALHYTYFWDNIKPIYYFILVCYFVLIIIYIYSYLSYVLY